MRCIDAEFGSKLGNVNHTRQRAIVELIIKGESIKFYSIGSSHRRLVLEKYFNLNKNLIYIDNPFILDDINEIIYIYVNQKNPDHRSKMLMLMMKTRNNTASEEVIAANKLEGDNQRDKLSFRR